VARVGPWALRKSCGTLKEALYTELLNVGLKIRDFWSTWKLIERSLSAERQRRTRTRSAAPELLQLTAEPAGISPSSTAPGSPSMSAARPFGRRKPSYVPASASMATQLEDEKSGLVALAPERKGTGAVSRKSKASEVGFFWRLYAEQQLTAFHPRPNRSTR
jgi:hypothetical protein